MQHWRGSQSNRTPQDSNHLESCLEFSQYLSSLSLSRTPGVVLRQSPHFPAIISLSCIHLAFIESILLVFTLLFHNNHKNICCLAVIAFICLNLYFGYHSAFLLARSPIENLTRPHFAIYPFEIHCLLL